MSMRRAKTYSLFNAILMALMLLTFSPDAAQAQCANPAGDAGDMIYNADHSVVQWCDGTDWYAAGGGSDTLSGLSCTDVRSRVGTRAAVRGFVRPCLAVAGEALQQHFAHPAVLQVRQVVL